MNWSDSYCAPVRHIQLIAEPCVRENSMIVRGLGVFRDRIARRCAATTTLRPAEFTLMISVDTSIGTDGFRIRSDEAGAVITGSCPRAVVYGLGKYLHTSGYSAEGFHPSRWQGTSVPTSVFRGIQMDTHWCNFYHMAPEHELREYVEDIALWGINYLEVVFPFIDLHDWDDPELDRITGQIKIIHDTAKALGVKVGLEVVPNQDFVDQNVAVQAELCPGRPGGKNGHNICPNKPGAIEYILNHTYGQVFRHLNANGVTLDFLCFWPYDEGGCGCEECAPWGANGYLKASKAVYEAIKADVPGVEVILSTWMFDTVRLSGPKGGTIPNDEWEGLTRALAEGNDWIDYILADARADFPRYPLEHGVPGGLPLLNYPEISMWALKPWGGYGANPLPERFGRLWQQVKGVVQGGMAYSEGIFNDINKVLVSQFYWDRDTTADAILREYIGYEYAPFVYDEVRRAIGLMEQNHEKAAYSVVGIVANPEADPEIAQQVCELLRDVDERLDAWVRKSWRWRLLMIRAELDVLRYTCAREQADTLVDHKRSWTSVMEGCDQAKPLLTELCQILHANLDYDNETHPHYHCVRPQIMDV